MALRNKLCWFSVIVLFIPFFACAHSSLRDLNQTSSDIIISEWPKKDYLRRKIRHIRKEIWAYGTANPDYAVIYKTIAGKLAKRTTRYQITVKPDHSVTDKDKATLPLLLIGTPASNSILADIGSSLPIAQDPKGFTLAGKFYADPNDVYVIKRYPNPFAPDLPLSIISGNTDAGIIEFIENFSMRSARAGDFAVFRNGLGAALGFFEDRTDGPWMINPNEIRDFLAGSNPVVETDHYRFIYHGHPVPFASVSELAEKQDRRLKELLDKLTPYGDYSHPFSKIEYHLYQSIEDKGLMTGNTDLSHINEQYGQVHAIFNDNLKGNDFYSDASLMILKYLGRSESIALQQGLGMYFSKGWGRHGFRFWAKRIYDSKNANSLRELLDPEIYRKESYLYMRPLAGSLVEFLITEFGWDTFIQMYQSLSPSEWQKEKLIGISLSELEKKWFAYLGGLDIPEQDKAASGHNNQDPEFQKGFSYAHEGYQIYNGYLSRKSNTSMRKLRSMGVNWISISPYGYMKERTKPGYLRYSSGAGSENDESIATAFYAAKKLGMRVMLKPHVLMYSRNWGWPGEIKMTNESDWQQFFKFYYSWIRHYAILAEMYGVDIFCIGVELVHATRHHSAQWQEMILKIRQIYHGPLVYAANWGEEFENLTFWDALDYIGLNCYYPLSDKNSPTLQELKTGADEVYRKIETIAKKYRKPVLLTEVGFTSTQTPWKVPHERDRSAAPSMEGQALAYQAFLEAFWEKPWIYGFYWWKWPTYLDLGGEHHNGFTPNGKPAEEVIRTWYLNGYEPKIQSKWPLP